MGFINHKPSPFGGLDAECDANVPAKSFSHRLLTVAGPSVGLYCPFVLLSSASIRLCVSLEGPVSSVVLASMLRGFLSVWWDELSL